MKKLAAFFIFFAFITFKGSHIGETAKPVGSMACLMPGTEGGPGEMPTENGALEKEDDQHPACFSYQPPHPVALAQLEPMPDRRRSTFHPAPGTPPPDVC